MPAAMPSRRGAAALALLYAALGTTPAAATEPPLGSEVGNIAEALIEVPSVFPAATAALTNAAFPGGTQPKKLRYWPQLRYGMANRTLLGCHKYTVLHTTEKGWPGLCVNLARNVEAATVDACRNFCRQEPRCSVFQFVNQTSPGQCWVGFGTNCGTRGNEQTQIVVQAAERIMHGNVRVLKSLQGIKVHNLYNLGFESGTSELSMQRCKDWCYSNIACEYWQYSDQSGGCWVDAPMFTTNQGANPENVVQYPLTLTGGASQDGSFQVGEYIAHYCPPVDVTAPVMPTLPPTTVTESGGQGIPDTVWWLLGAGVIAGLGFFVYTQQQKGTGKGNAKGAAAGKGKKGGKKEYDAAYSEEGSPLMQAQRMTPPSARAPAPYPGQAQAAAPATQQAMGQTNSYGPQPPATQQAMVPPPPHFQQQQQQPGQQRGYQQGGYQQGGYQPSYGGGAVRQGIPPPTQLVDFGQGSSQSTRTQAAMAPTQLLQQGVPFPNPPQQYR